MPLDSKPIPRVSAKKYKGLGDVIAVVAQPIAIGLDSVFHTSLENCGGCKKRQENFNRLFPFNNEKTPQ